MFLNLDVSQLEISIEIALEQPLNASSAVVILAVFTQLASIVPTELQPAYKSRADLALEVSI